jgi:hypothetical protein
MTTKDDSELSSNNNLTQPRRGRGRPVGTGRKRAAGSSPKMFRNFSMLSRGLMAVVRLDPKNISLTEDEIIQKVLVGHVRAESIRLSNSNPKRAKWLASLLAGVLVDDDL